MKTTKNKTNITKQFISLEEIIAAKNPKLLKFIPKFILTLFKKFICLDKINDIIYRYRYYNGVDFANALLNELNIQREIYGKENIPLQGRPLVVANHPLGSIDGVTLISIMGSNRKDILFPVNDILCQLPGLKDVFVPINKYGRNESNHNALNKAFVSDAAMCFFPAGTESKIINGKLQDFAWKKSFVNKAQQFNRDIIPVHIEGRNSKAFYRLFKIRRFLGIKFDLEMIMLPREMFKQKGKKITLTFGKIIPSKKLDTRYNSLQWADKIRSYVYELHTNKNAEFKYQ
ncbi:MAG: 1-acyl-sn-glycerol-3-phosphate acyltransferase [Bacteroidales bacterium]